MYIMDIVDFGKDKKMKAAIFIALTPNYIPYVNALLNSIEKRRIYDGVELDVYLLYHDFDDMKFIKEAEKAFSFNLIPIDVKRSEIQHPEETKRIEFIKRARFSYILELSMKYDVTCMLDADMLIVSEQLKNLFALVCGTDKMIGCNERYKWVIGDNFEYNGKPIFNTPTKLYHMHCSVPIIFDMKKWSDVFQYYTDICFKGRQQKGNNIVGIGDIYCWNISMIVNDRQNDIIVFPMETMTQVHQTNLKPSTFLISEKDYWHTNQGDRVYSIHGRIAEQNWYLGHLQRYRQDLEKEGAVDMIKRYESKVDAGLRALQQEWYDLNFNGKLPIGKVCDIMPYWSDFNRRK